MRNKKIVLLAVICVGVLVGLSGCGKPYSDIKLSDYIKLGEYKGLEVLSYSIDVTDEEIDAEINKKLEAAATVEEVKTGTVENGDTVVINYEGKISGKSFEGGSAEGASLTIGSGQFIAGFEEGLIGVEVGKTKVLKLKFPDDYTGKEVAGKDVEFTVTVNSKQQRTVQTLSEEFVKNTSKAKTIEDYKVGVKEELLKTKEKRAIQQQKDYLWNKIVEASEVQKDKEGKEKFPKDKIEAVANKTTEEYKNYAKEFNMDFEGYLKQQMGMDEKTFRTQVEEYAKIVIKQEEVIYSIAEKENIEISKKDYKKFIKDTLAEHGYTEETFKELTGKTYEEAMGKENIMREAYRAKVLAFVLEQAKVVDQLSTPETE